MRKTPFSPVVIISFATASFLLACAQEKPTQPSTVTAAATTTTPAEAHEKVVKISPQVAALLAPDPDLEVTLTKEEIRATLEAAQQRSAPPPMEGPTATAQDGQWQKMEADQKTKNEKWKTYLANTFVAAHDGSYHNRSCRSLFRTYIDSRNRERTAYLGVDITLQTAFDQRLARHTACGAPSYESHY